MSSVANVILLLQTEDVLTKLGQLVVSQSKKGSRRARLRKAFMCVKLKVISLLQNHFYL